MQRLRSLLAGMLAALALVGLVVPAAAREPPRNDQGRGAARKHRPVPSFRLREIERRILAADARQRIISARLTIRPRGPIA